jgi:hypothetical protein
MSMSFIDFCNQLSADCEALSCNAKIVRVTDDDYSFEFILRCSFAGEYFDLVGNFTDRYLMFPPNSSSFVLRSQKQFFSLSDFVNDRLNVLI